MTKKKVIAIKNLPFQIGLIGSVVNLWFLWDKLPWEWARTLLIVLYVLYIGAWIGSIFTEEQQDVLK